MLKILKCKVQLSKLYLLKVGNSCLGLGHAHKCGGVKPLNEIPIPPLFISSIFD
jgi:hypothetical protein